MPPLQTKAVKKFGGLQQYKTSSAVSMDEALKCMNVITSPGGFLQKMRIPTPLTPQIAQSGNARIVPFQQGDGTRQLLVMLGTQIWLYTTDALLPVLIDDNPLNAATWSATPLNNLLFLANGKRMLKWTGQFLQPWGIAQPPAPTLGVELNILLTRAGGVATCNVGELPIPPDGNGWSLDQLRNFNIGDKITISEADDPSFEGDFLVTVSTGFTVLKFNNPGPDVSTPIAGTIIIFSSPCANSSTDFQVSEMEAAKGIALAVFTNDKRIEPGDQFTIAGGSGAYAAFNGTFICDALVDRPPFFIGAVSWKLDTPDIALAAVTGVTISAGFDNSTSGRMWKCAWKNSVTGHEGSASDAVGPCPNVFGNLRAYLSAPKPTDGQVDTVVWYATLNGGGDFFKVQEAPISAGLIFGDGRSDALLDTQTRCQLINNVPPVGKYLVKWQERIYIAGIVGAPQDIAYSGYERILVGRPEESFPPNNRLRLSIGADEVRAMGAIQAGLVAWSASSEMYMLRGSVEDIVTDNPVPPSSYLEQLPWNQGANSHYSVQGTPQGLLWYASDNTIQSWSGTYLPEYQGPQQMSESVLPLLSRANPTQKQFASGTWLNVGDREWYILNLALDQSTQANRLIYFDTTPGDDNAGAFESNIQADDVQVWEDSTGLQHLLILQNGGLLDLPYHSFLENGLVGVNVN
jgi:hypothetical protein